MLMPLERLRAIYELLFREGVMVAKKDRRPHSFHPQLPGVSHLQVMRAMGSLKARGLVRETFAWRHAYWYLTDEGIAHLRQYLRLPPEIVPLSLQRVRRGPVPVPPSRRAAAAPRVQTVPGPLACPPKREEGWGARQAYRRKEEPPEPHVEPVAVGGVSQPAPQPSPGPGQPPAGAG
ncbi:plectin-like [Alligator mississippiensis]|uniref:Plectin-like n=1 Tax=Alligator mississippiensis TaxID=8496 RepID=A0A151NZQ9_ALLMI|nr:plectin-like [Alligator mississippiensis]